jgi:pimeloyl-ACP methyl ester carboxylesterase
MKYIVALAIFCAAAFSLSAQVNPFDTTQFGKNDKAGAWANIRGIKMYYETYGQGQPLLIIHGNGGSINNFVFQIPYFMKHYKVIIADSRAQGKTKDNADSLSYEMMTDDYAALLDHLKIDSANVIGWSDGGINGLLLAIRHPKKVKKLAITGANLWPDSSAVDPFAFNWALQLNKQMATAPQNDTIRAQRKLLRLLSFEPHIALSDLKKISCPTLVMGGDADVILPQHTMLIAANIKNSNLWIVPNSGHSVPLRYKDEFNKTVDDFFKQPFKKKTGFELFD